MSELRPLDDEELLRDGIGHWWDATFALRAFEQGIQAIARKVVMANIVQLWAACGSGKNFEDNNVWLHGPERDCQPGQIALGIGVTWEWGVRVGVGWRTAETSGGMAPIACVSLRGGSRTKRDRLATAFRRASALRPVDGVLVEPSQDWPYDLNIWMPMPDSAGSAEIATALQTALVAMISWSQASGSLQTILYGSAAP